MNVCIYVNIVNVCILYIVQCFLQLLSVLYRIVSKITISSRFVSIRIVSCDDRIVSSLFATNYMHSAFGEHFQRVIKSVRSFQFTCGTSKPNIFEN